MIRVRCVPVVASTRARCQGRGSSQCVVRRRLRRAPFGSRGQAASSRQHVVWAATASGTTRRSSRQPCRRFAPSGLRLSCSLCFLPCCAKNRADGDSGGTANSGEGGRASSGRASPLHSRSCVTRLLLHQHVRGATGAGVRDASSIGGCVALHSRVVVGPGHRVNALCGLLRQAAQPGAQADSPAAASHRQVCGLAVRCASYRAVQRTGPMATAVEQQIVVRVVEHRAAEHRVSIHARALRAGRCINPCAVPLERQTAMRRPSATAPRSIRKSWSGSLHRVNKLRGLLRQAAQPPAPADSPVAASRRQVCC